MILGVGNQCFLGREFEFHLISKEFGNFRFQIDCVLFAPDYSNQEIISVPNIVDTLEICVHFISAWNQEILSLILFERSDNFLAFSVT